MTAPTDPAPAAAEALDLAAFFERRAKRPEMGFSVKAFVTVEDAHLIACALRLLAQQQPAQAPALAEENKRLRAAINQMAHRMDSRAADADRVIAPVTAAVYRHCADIVSEELARALADAEAGQ
ncbi:hypothetical protein Q0M94_28530 (plasmid) [Deinococcus radiomollis]|uniref:hypothetical protein n=1 Tax=Deinococcus radiomollis TaxID=468916 RepID=UPI003892B00E